ncbi:MAG: hypothetical protein WC069_03385 [Candidatus Shapirobacteria bacterium]
MKRVVKERINFDETVAKVNVDFLDKFQAEDKGFLGLVETATPKAVAMGRNRNGFLVEALVLEDVEQIRFREDEYYSTEIIRRAYQVYNIVPVQAN